MNVALSPSSSDAFLQRVEHLLAERLRGEPHVLASQVTTYATMQKGAKRFRPRLVQAFGQALGLDQARLVTIATAVEMIHCASLMHDDVVDDGMVRRGFPTANATWGNPIAVLSGDVLLIHALQLITDVSPHLTTIALDAIAQMSRAAIHEVQYDCQEHTSTDIWMAIAEGKTGALFELCGRAVARASERFELENDLGLIGQAIGKAFQLTDDLVDFSTDSGKEYLTDIRFGRPNFVVLEASSRSTAVRRRFSEAATKSRPLALRESEELASLVKQTGALQEGVSLVSGYIDAVIQSLQKLPQNEGVDAIAFWSNALRQKSRSLLLQDTPIESRMQ